MRIKRLLVVVLMIGSFLFVGCGPDPDGCYKSVETGEIRCLTDEPEPQQDCAKLVSPWPSEMGKTICTPVE